MLVAPEFPDVAFSDVDPKLVNDVETQPDGRDRADESEEESVRLVIGHAIQACIQQGGYRQESQAEDQKIFFHEVFDESTFGIWRIAPVGAQLLRQRNTMAHGSRMA